MGSTPETILGGGVPWATGYTPTLAQWDALFAYKQDGNLQSVLPVQTVTGASKVFATVDLQMKTRRSNSGSAMTDTFPASSASGMVNGARISIANTDATASITVTAGSGTLMPSGSTDTIGPGRDVSYEYDLANTTWRGSYNTRTALVGPANSAAIPSANVTALGNTLNAASGLLQLNGSGRVPQANLTARASYMTPTPLSPTAPASIAAYFMQGLAATITPATSGAILITISGTVVAPSGTTVDNGILYQIVWGTGTAPANAVAIGSAGTACTAVGPVQQYTSAIAPTAAADVHVPFCVSYLVTGLTLGTTYWVDLAAQSVTTASAMGLSNVAVVITEQ